MQSLIRALLLSRHNNKAVRRRYEYNEPTELLILPRLKWIAGNRSVLGAKNHTHQYLIAYEDSTTQLIDNVLRCEGVHVASQLGANDSHTQHNNYY